MDRRAQRSENTDLCEILQLKYVRFSIACLSGMIRFSMIFYLSTDQNWDGSRLPNYQNWFCVLLSKARKFPEFVISFVQIYRKKFLLI